MKYLKMFDNHAAYEAAESSLILPNVSLCVNENEVHYNPYVEPIETRVVAKFNVTSTSSPTKIASATTGFSSIEIDGVVQPSVTTGYTFSTTGEHTVKYVINGTSIGNQVFGNCSNLASIVIPDSVTSIGGRAFRDCSGLTSCTIGSSVTSIGDSAFEYCSSISSIVIPDSVTSIGSYAFEYCSSLSSIVIPNSVTSIDSNTFSSCYALTSIDIPNSVTSIGSYAFEGCSSISSIVIPNSVTSIGDNAFYGCNGLNSIYVYPSDPPYLGSDAFGDTNDCPIYVSDVETYASADGWSNYEDRLQ